MLDFGVRQYRHIATNSIGMWAIATGVVAIEQVGKRAVKREGCRCVPGGTRRCRVRRLRAPHPLGSWPSHQRRGCDEARGLEGEHRGRGGR